jgi:hypothetical protein
MSNIKITDLPFGTADPSGVVPCDNPAGTVTEKITLAAIRDLPHSHEDNDIFTTINSVAISITDSENPNRLQIGTTKIVIITSVAGVGVDGFEPYPEGENYSDIRIVSNTGQNDITFLHESAPAGPQIKCANNVNYDLSPGASVLIYYDNINDCWRLG